MKHARRVVIGIGLLALCSCSRAAAPPPSSSSTSTPSSDATAEPTRERNPWDDARTRGIEFRAVGQEPGWYLEIDNERWMRLFYAYAERTASAPVPMPVEPGRAATLEATADGHVLKVEIASSSCEDAMSGEPFPATVTVTIDGSVLKGCGRWLTR